ncbi:HEAT repeat domain-containing protein [Parafrankia sp. BMG5.11]|uniref:HEAT repeat domain-containing protein n=1 Tax=Parafrankia sp. BMG5.11 TaxID=222540 RepID=UPI00103E8AD8|nr:HEAT repeat domain-containing protein [Parafrankia sp. BMG5.11]TCJ34205.1 HEAT repeat domain-containing protein [Parafrankia sp. BMG5.11]
MVLINTTSGTPLNTRVANALGAKDSSVRLQAALAVGSNPDPGLLETLVERCAVEPDFFVRDMLSWALTRFSPRITLPRIRQELDSERAQARSQALHTLGKIGDKGAWAWITRDMLRDADDEVARTAWRVAVALVPEGEKKALADELVVQLGRGDRSVQLSLSRALVDLGDVIEPALEKAAANPDPAVAAHARATELLLRDPETGFNAAIDEARRVIALGPERAAAAAAAAAGVAEPSEVAEPSKAACVAAIGEPTETTESTGAVDAVDAVEAVDC